ncbi:MAG: hypothetical protein E7600_03635 [Ruminococcaceae bacterium]|nr:hypothetical protein [Oscillospiraceae bacterium]
MKRTLVLIIAIIMTVFLAACSEGSGGTYHPPIASNLETCSQCKGNGICSVCDGRGENSYAGNPARTCTICDGDGVCVLCGGSGAVTAETNEQSIAHAKKELDRMNGILYGDSNTSSGTSSGTVCDECNGVGYLNSECTSCSGTGVDSSYHLFDGSVIQSFAEKDCYKCNGTGLKKCIYCSGTGVN